MKESLWGVLIVGLGLFGVAVVNVFQNVTVDNDRVYYLLKETTEAAAYDAIDLTNYRLTGTLRMVEDKFVENFTRRFAQNVTVGDYTIIIEDINELPPKVSLRIRSGITSLQGEEFGIVNRVDGILETKYSLDEVLDFLDITEEEWKEVINESKVKVNPNTGENTCKVSSLDDSEMECISGDLKFVGFGSVSLQKGVCSDDVPNSNLVRTVNYKECNCGKWEEKNETVVANPVRQNNIFSYTWIFNKIGEIRKINEIITDNVPILSCTTGVGIMVPKNIEQKRAGDFEGEYYIPSTDNSQYELCPSGGIRVHVGMKFRVNPNYNPSESINRYLKWKVTDSDVLGIRYNKAGNESENEIKNHSINNCMINGEGSNCFLEAYIIANKVGTSYINVETTRGQTATCKVEVFDSQLQNLYCEDVVVEEPWPKPLKAIFVPENLSSENLEWSVVDESIAEVWYSDKNKSWMVRGKREKRGTTQINVKDLNSGLTASCNLKVTPHVDEEGNNGGGSSNSGSSGTSTTKYIGGCFLKGTKVLTKNGYKDINKIKVGDMVLSYNVHTKQNEYKKVTKLFIHKNMNDVLYTFTVNNKKIEASSMHRFYVRIGDRYKWLPASSLRVGDILMDKDGKYYSITNISSKKIFANLYNLEVDGNHNYYVTDSNILVHNAKVGVCVGVWTDGKVCGG